VYGHADLLLRIDEEAAAQALRNCRRRPAPHSRASHAGFDPSLLAAAPNSAASSSSSPPAASRCLNPGDYRTIDAYIVHLERE
jgi:hypothetical protein